MQKLASDMRWMLVPDDFDALLGIGNCLLGEQLPEQAERVFRRAIVRRSTSGQRLESLGHIPRRAKLETTGAQQAFERAVLLEEAPA